MERDAPSNTCFNSSHQVWHSLILPLSSPKFVPQGSTELPLRYKCNVGQMTERGVPAAGNSWFLNVFTRSPLW